MAKIISARLLIIIILSSFIAFSGCSGKDQVKKLEGPIQGWEDVALPENITWVRTTFSGKIENHEYQVDMTETEFFYFLEEAMALNAWNLTKAVPGTRDYEKAEDRVSINTKPSVGSSNLTIVIVIEPKGAYGTTN